MANKINTSKWQDFTLGDLFEIKLPAARSEKKYDTGDVKYVSSGAYNNGVVNYLKPKEGEVLDKGQCITVSPLDGSSFWQDEDFMGRGGSGASISMLYNDNLNMLRALFVCSVIRNTAQKFDYSDLLNSKNLRTLNLKLPATPDGQPDWDYMESYMKTVIEESKKALENLNGANNTKHLIDVDRWGKFNCGELFECKNTGNILARDVEDGTGTTPYVTASGYNNGVVGYIDASNYDIIKGHCILVGGKTFTITYQKDDFVSNDSHNFVIRIKDREVSDLCYLYLASVIYAYFGQKYSWSDAVTKDKLMSDNIPLPVNSNGEPDWQYMESYMRKTIIGAEQALRCLREDA